MTREPWRVEVLSQVEEFIEARERVPKKQIRNDLKKLAAYGDQAREPLVRQVEGKVWELRSKVDNHGLYRVFYFRSGASSFCAFDAYKKGGQKLPKRVRERVLRRYTELTGNKP